MWDPDAGRYHLPEDVITIITSCDQARILIDGMIQKLHRVCLSADVQIGPSGAKL
jgi:hypothetical protein